MRKALTRERGGTMMRRAMTTRRTVLAALALPAWLAACGSSSTSTGNFEEGITALARASVPDVAAWQACRATAEPGTRVDADKALGEGAGVRTTPTFFVNG